MRGATAPAVHLPNRYRISTHAPLAGRDLSKLAYSGIYSISTHAPLAGRDLGVPPKIAAKRISTHAPLAGRDDCTSTRRPTLRIFQPTRPLRGATRGGGDAVKILYISTHAPLAGRDHHHRRGDARAPISTHAPLAGRDAIPPQATGGILIFQPTRPLRGATQDRPAQRRRARHFNPRAPCGARPA